MVLVLKAALKLSKKVDTVVDVLEFWYVIAFYIMQGGLDVLVFLFTNILSILSINVQLKMVSLCYELNDVKFGINKKNWRK